MPIMTPIKENVEHNSDLDAVSEGEDGGPHIKKKVLRSAKKVTKEKEVTETQDDVEEEVVGEKGDETSVFEQEGTSRAVRKLTYSSDEGFQVTGVVAKKVATKQPRSKSQKAGLVLPVKKVYDALKKGRYAPKVRVEAAVVMSATLEYLVAEVLELAGNCSKYMKKRRIIPHHIQMTFLHDSELSELTKGVIVPEGGVKPHIHKELLPPHLRDENQAGTADGDENAASTEVSSS